MPVSAASLANLRPFRPGKSGFAGQQPRGYRVTLTAARKASPEAMQTIIECMQDPNAPWPARIKACELILERAWGKPDQRTLRDEEGISSLTIKFVGPDGIERPYDEAWQTGRDVAKAADGRLINNQSLVTQSKAADGRLINDQSLVTQQRLPPSLTVHDPEQETTILPSQAHRLDMPVSARHDEKVPSFRARNAAGIFR